MAVTKIESKKNASAVAEMPAKSDKTYEGLTRQQLVDIYRLMYLSRRLDDKEKVLKNQQKTFFQISSAGHEALTVAVASIPGSRPSSSAASRVMSETTRCGPAWISTSAETLSLVTLVMTPGKALRLLVCAGAGSIARRSAKIRATSDCGTIRWPPVVRSVLSLPARSQVRSVSTRTPRSFAASPIR